MPDQPTELNTPASQPGPEQTLQTLGGVPPTRAPALESGPVTLPLSATEQGPLPHLVAGYAVEKELGRGGMGVVYKARQLSLNRVVALKMIRQAELAGAAERLRFLREAEALAKLEHPNIVRIHEVGEWEGKPFFSMEYVPGGNLEKHLNGRPLPERVAATLVETLARAMHAAHQAGVVHRDLKPANILLQKPKSETRNPNEDRSQAQGDAARAFPVSDFGFRISDLTPKVTDFGLAKTMGETGQSKTGDVMGTPQYMAPEQAAGKVHDIDARTDVYALGVILYECLTGKPPFRAASTMDTILQVINDEPVSVRRLARVHSDLETICHRCLQKERGKRYATALDLAEDLRRYQAGEPIAARPVGRAERFWNWCRRNPAVATLGAAVVLLLLAGTVVSTMFALHAAREARRARQHEAEALAERDRFEGLLYADHIDLVQRHWEEKNVPIARRMLAATAEKRRGWEYRYLDKLINRGGQESLSFDGPGEVVDLAPLPGNRFVVAYRSGAVLVREAPTGRALDRFEVAAPSCLGVLPGGAVVAVGGKDGKVTLRDAETGRTLSTLHAHQGEVRAVRISPDGKQLASLGPQNAVKLWEVATSSLALTIPTQVSCYCLDFSPDGDQLATGGEDGFLRVWSAQTGREDLRLDGHVDRVTVVRFSSDGRRVASAGHDRSVRVWDAASGRQLHELLGHTSFVSRLSFSPDGRRLASGDYDPLNTSRPGMVILWDVETGGELLTLKGAVSGIAAITFNLDGEELLAGSGSNVRLWSACPSGNLDQR